MHTPPTIGRGARARHRRAGGIAAQPAGGDRSEPRADDGERRPGLASTVMFLPTTATATEQAVAVRGLRVRYGDVEAVRGIDLDVRRGEILALLGPNGAGKTSTIEILEGFRAAAGGEVAVLGADPRRAPRAWRDRLGIVLQESAPELEPHRARVPAALRRLLQRAARRRRDDRARRARGAARPRGDEAVRRPAPAARRRARADRRPGADLPRRADHRLRPRGAPPGVGGHRRAARARQDDRAHHPLHGGGRAARRPDRRDGARRDRRRRHAGDARRARPRRGASSRSRCRPARTGRRRAATIDERGRVDAAHRAADGRAARADRLGARPRARADRPRGPPARRSRTSTWS